MTDALIVAPGQYVRDAQELVELANLILKRAAVAERIRGTRWDQIGDAAGGVTRATAHGRFSAAVEVFLGGTGEEWRQARATAELDDGWAQVAELAGRVARRAVILEMAAKEEAR